MPFTNVAVAPSTTPPVTILLSGLMVIQPGPNNNTCEIGVHKFSRTHSFQVILVVNKPNRPPALVPIFTGPLLAPFEIRLATNPEPIPDFVVFARDPFDRTLPNSDPLDHRWAINMRLKHATARINDGAKPVITLKTGTMYTPNLTDPSLAPKLTRTGSPVDLLRQIASHLAVSITPPAGTKVLLKGLDLGDPLTLAVPRDKDPVGTQYTLCLINEPTSILADPHDEFPLYYQILEDTGAPIPSSVRFNFEFASGATSDEVPCMPITLIP
jgi:hypothetical protein